MGSMKKLLPLLLLIVIVFIVAVFSHKVQAATDNEKNLKIGLILPLSGEWAFLGEGIRDGAILAQNDLKKNDIEVKLIFDDNQGELSKSANLASRLIADQHVDVLISIISGVGKILKPMTEKAGILNIGICSDTAVANGKNSFINYLTAEQGVAKFVDYFPKAFPGSTLGIFSLNEAGFQRILDRLNYAASGKINIVRIENFDKGVTDFRSQLLRMRSSSPGAILLLGLSPEIELIAKQAKSIHLDVPLTSIEGFGLASDKSPFEGSWFVDSAVPSDLFQRRFQQQYGREITPGVGHAYDSVMLIGSTLSNSKNANSHLLESFRNISKYNGVIGPLTVRDDGIIWSEASIKIIRNGKVVKQVE